MVDNIKEKVLALPDIEEIKITREELDKKIDEYNKEVKDFRKNRGFLGITNHRYSLINQKEFEQTLERCASYVYSYLRRNDIIEP